jgi:hypothetical protein
MDSAHLTGRMSPVRCAAPSCVGYRETGISPMSVALAIRVLTRVSRACEAEANG